MFAVANRGGGVQGSADLVEGTEAVGVDSQGRVGLGAGVLEGHMDSAQLSPIDGVGFG